VATPIVEALTPRLRPPGYNPLPPNPFAKGGYSPLTLPGFQERLNPNPTNPYAGQGYSVMPFTTGNPLVNTGIDPEFWSGTKQVTPNLPPGFHIKVYRPSVAGNWAYYGYAPGVQGRLGGSAPGYGGAIARMTVNPSTQRVSVADTERAWQGRGIGSALFNKALETFPKLMHSTTLSPAGLAYAASTMGYNQGNVVPGVLREHEPGEGGQTDFTAVLKHLYSGKTITEDFPFVGNPEEAYSYALNRWKQLKPGSNPFFQAAPERLAQWQILNAPQFQPGNLEPNPIPRENLGQLREQLRAGFDQGNFYQAVRRFQQARQQAANSPEAQQLQQNLQQGFQRGLARQPWAWGPRSAALNEQLSQLPASQVHRIHDAYLRGDISREQWAHQMQRLGLNPPPIA